MASTPRITAFPQNPLVNSVSMASTITSEPSNINGLPGISYDVSWTGSPVGNFVVQVSNTYKPNADGTVTNTGNWSDLPTSVFVGIYPTPSGSPGHGMLDVVGTECAWVRLVYTPTSGTGNLTVVPAAKVL